MSDSRPSSPVDVEEGVQVLEDPSLLDLEDEEVHRRLMNIVHLARARAIVEITYVDRLKAKVESVSGDSDQLSELDRKYRRRLQSYAVYVKRDLDQIGRISADVSRKRQARREAADDDEPAMENVCAGRTSEEPDEDYQIVPVSALVNEAYVLARSHLSVHLQILDRVTRRPRQASTPQPAALEVEMAAVVRELYTVADLLLSPELATMPRRPPPPRPARRTSFGSLLRRFLHTMFTSCFGVL